MSESMDEVRKLPATKDIDFSFEPYTYDPSGIRREEQRAARDAATIASLRKQLDEAKAVARQMFFDGVKAGQLYSDSYMDTGDTAERMFERLYAAALASRPQSEPGSNQTYGTWNMSKNCIRCVVRDRTDIDLVCDDCRVVRAAQAYREEHSAESAVYLRECVDRLKTPDAPGAAKYIPDVPAAQEHLLRLFNACGDGSGKLDAGWVMTVTTKAMEALSEGISTHP